jgi:hypothetical protein
MGGTDDPSNLVKLTIEEHAEAHRILYEKYGLDEDRLAWLGLSKMIDKKEHIYEMSKIAGRKTVTLQVGIHDPKKIHLKQDGGRKGIAVVHQKMKNNKWMNNGVRDTRVIPEKIEEYVSAGWSFGRLFSPNKGKKNMTKNLFWINKNEKNRRIPEDQIDFYINQGWSPGMHMKN